MSSATAVADIGEQQWQEVLNVDDGPWDLTTFGGVGFRSDGSVLVSGSGGGGFAARYDAQSGDLLDTPPEWIDFETTSQNFNYFYDQVIDSNGDIFFAGRHNVFDPGVWKYNSSAALQSGWPKVHAGVGDGRNTGVALDSLGYVYSAGYNDSGWLISKHAKSDGTVPTGFPISYNNGYGGKAGQVAVDSENNFIVSGWIGVAGGSYDWHVRKYASDGALLWQTSYDLKGNIEAAIDVAVDSEDNIIVIGYRNDGTDEAAGIARDWYMVKYTKDGDGNGGGTVLWEQSWNSGKTSASYVARALIIDSEDNVYVGGEQPDSSETVSRPLVQYRDGQTGELIRSQDIGHPNTVNGNANAETDIIGDLALNGDQLVVVGYVWEGYKPNGRTAWISMFKLLPDVGGEDWSSAYYSPTSIYSALFLDVDILSDGKILATGNKPWSQGLAIRYDADTGVPADNPPEWISKSNPYGMIQFRGQTFDSSGNIYFAGIEQSTMKVWKYSADSPNTPSTLIWEASGPSSSINNYNVAVDSSGNSYSVGGKNNAVSGSSGSDGILNKFDSNGDPAGAPFPIAYNHNDLSDTFFGVAVDSNDNVVVSGWVGVSADVDHLDGLVQKYDSNGILLWQRQYDGVGSNDSARQVVVDSDDNIIVVGSTNNGTYTDWYIIKYAHDGALVWQQTWDDGTGRTGYGRDIAIDEQNNLYVVGEQGNSDGMRRVHVQYRDGQTGDLLKIQELSHPQTHHKSLMTEMDSEASISLKDGKLAVSGYTTDTSNPSTHKLTAFVIALDRTFVVMPSNNGNGTTTPFTIQTIAYGETLTSTLNPDDHYHVDSVGGTCPAGSAPTDNGDGTWSYTTGDITFDCTVVTNFAIDTFDVTPTKNGNGAVTPFTVQTVDYNETATFTLDPDDHWYIDDVTGSCPAGSEPSDNGDGTWSYTTGNIDADCEVTVNFAIDTFDVTPSQNGNGTTTPFTVQTIDHNETATFTLEPDDHWHVGNMAGTCLVGSLIDEMDGTWTYTTGAITVDCTVIFNYAIDTFDVTPSKNGSGTIDPGTVQNVTYNDTIRFTLDPDDHWHVDNVGGTCPAGSASDNGDGTWSYTTGNIDADCEVTANFAIDTFEVTPSTDGDGSIDPSWVSDVAYNTSFAFTLYPNATYHPEPVSGTCPAGSLVDNGDADPEPWTYTTGLITFDCTVDFSFDNTFDVTPSSVGLGSIDPSAVVEEVIYGQTVEFTLTPTTDKPPEPVTGTCPVGSAPIDQHDGTWSYTTGLIEEDCTVIFTFEGDTTFFVIPIQGNKAVIFGL